MLVAAHSSTPAASSAKQARGWSPYVMNGGTCLAIAGDDYAILAADTRLSLGYSIMSRDFTKISKLTDKCCIATSGMQADAQTLHKVLGANMKMFEHQHSRPMSTRSIGQNLANTLYYKRFFPYYTFNVVAGLDEKGEGIVFSYDAIGCSECMKYTAAGSGSSLIEPFLDNQVGLKNQQSPSVTKRTVEECIELVKDTFSSAGERDIYTGDFVEIHVITKEGTKVIKHQLKFD